ncbi:hypothetical protein CPT_Shady_050 [Streptomyces phage Shady]|uniref:Uncharacterized protein n=1 Tax=Streptomyces phage Shady TaxID=2767585 RepID=A0A873WQ61_9CAUD|nr:hypothetical protein CPT_Shady_050 [Streptomyces phage Shady]
MDWEWFRPVDGVPGALDWFIISIRRVVKGPDKVYQGMSLTMIDRPHKGEETKSREMFPDLDGVFAITGPLAKELRADGWDKTPPADPLPRIDRSPKPVLRLVQRRGNKPEGGPEGSNNAERAG